jgi:phage terminase large subunit-like protein
MLSFDDLVGAIEGEEFEEIPVSIEEFVTGEKYLNLPFPLSEYQYQLIKASSQIYKRDTLHRLYGFDLGEKRWKQTCNEVIFQLGKGSGKDYSSTIACAYIVYLLLCLKDPASYYGKPPGDTIDILNIAINATQAQNVFFAGFKNRITRSPWFEGKYIQKAGHFAFDKNVNVFSGHSEREAWEGYNVIYVVLDEISGFALESTSGNDQAKTAQAVYDMYRASVSSRFPEFGKIVLLSFPRFKGDFIQQRYNAVIAEKETITRTHTFKLDPDLPEGYEGNEFEVEWEEDHIYRYTTPRVYALKRPTWEVNPTKKIDDFTRDFFDNPIDSLSRFACMPPESIDGLFKDKQKVEEAFVAKNGVDEDGTFFDDFKPDSTKTYYVHVDLAKKHDHCAVSLAHVEKWVTREIAGKTTNPAPLVVVDAVRWWTPTKEKNVDFADVREYIVSLRRRGFNIRLVTFDRWRSDDMIDYLRDVGMRSEVLSVANSHYTDLVMVISEGRLLGPNVPLLKEELVKLRIMPNGKIDHPRTGSKDLADATCGAVYNAIAHTSRYDGEEIEIQTVSTLNRRPEPNKQQSGFDGIIRPPKATEPPSPELADFLSQLRLIGD